MGLDLVELVLSVEEEFGITISDADACKLTTIGEVTDYIASHVDEVQASHGHCLTQAQFYRLRSALSQQFQVSRRIVHPDSPIRSFLPAQGVPRHWRLLQRSIGAHNFPRLKCSKTLSYVIAAVFPLSFGLFLLTDLPLKAALVSSLVLWGTVAVIAQIKWADQIPDTFATVGSLVPYVPFPDRKKWTHGYIQQRIFLIASEQFGIPVQNIRPEHRFVEDLGAG